MSTAPDLTILRMIDANANRAREALRVMEDYARFALNDAALSGQLKTMRHTLAEVVAAPALAGAILERDTNADVGTTIKAAGEMHRTSIAEVVIAAGKRLSEALRVIEECCKTINGTLAQSVETVRYQGYVVEQALARAVGGGRNARQRFAATRLYVLLTEALCHPGAGGWEGVLRAIVSAAAATGGGEKVCIQLREKSLPDAELLRRARTVADICRSTGAISIINDRPDIARLANADGLHLGQDDLPLRDARRLLGPEKIIGISTENLDQARLALLDGATYLALGPMYPTTTKEKPRLAGPAYAAQAHRELPQDVPLVAIGGIRLDKLPPLQAAGVARVCVCSAIISQPDPAAATTAFLRGLETPQ